MSASSSCSVLDYTPSMSARTHTRTPSLTTSESESYSSGPVSPPPSPFRSVPLPAPSCHVYAPGFHACSTNIVASAPRPSVPPPPISNPVNYRMSPIAIFTHPRILDLILRYLSADDFRHLTYTCRDLRQILRQVNLKDVILAHFIPGYLACLQTRDLQQFVDVQVTLGDLQLFLMSRKVGLHMYPRHSLALMSSQIPPSDDLMRISYRLRESAQAYSRFVLLLQSIVHSSSSPTYEFENSECKFPFPSGMKELNFPAPLSYHELGVKDVSSVSVCKVTRRTASSPSAADFAMGPAVLRKRKTSIFGGSRLPLPPPSSEPALRQYSDSWRRALTLSSSWIVDDVGSLELPRRHFTSVDSPSESSSSSVSTFAPDRDYSSPVNRYTFPHDFDLASSRTHAPVLRVFVPCAEFDEYSIAACEDQLIDAGLWTHLSTGDIVCNLGYVPPPDAELASNGDSMSGSRAVWLLFNGTSLVPYSPPDPLPVDDFLTLPSPFYYSHILARFSNPIFTLDLASHLPLPNQMRSRFSLTSVLAKVKSPHSPGGFAMVKQYKWLASLRGPKVGVGSVWQTEWILEGEGTPEGRQGLEDLITGRERNAVCLWLIEREKCSQSRIWFRLLESHAREMNVRTNPAGTRTVTFSLDNRPSSLDLFNQ